jgi:hypothetical protein
MPCALANQRARGFAFGTIIRICFHRQRRLATAIGNAFAGKTQSRLRIYLPEAGIGAPVIEVGDLRPVHREQVAADLRLKSISNETSHTLAEMFVRSQSRVWGCAADDLVQMCPEQLLLRVTLQKTTGRIVTNLSGERHPRVAFGTLQP